MNKVMLMFAATFALIACHGKDGNMGPSGPQGPGPTIPTVSPVEQDVADLLAEENDYRLGLGQTALTSGLSCALSTFTAGDRIQASIAGHNTLSGLSQVATFLLKSEISQPVSPVSDGMSVLPAALRSIYMNMYLLRCQGQIVVTDTDHYLFELESDDGSVLYIDGAKVIDNDNNHGPTTVAGMKYLRRGVHTIRLDYAQSGGGSQALSLKVDGALLNPMVMAH